MMKILLNILEILMLLGIIRNYRLLKKRKKWLIRHFFIKIDRYKRILVSTIKKSIYIYGTQRFEALLIAKLTI